MKVFKTLAALFCSGVIGGFVVLVGYLGQNGRHEFLGIHCRVPIGYFGGTLVIAIGILMILLILVRDLLEIWWKEVNA